ncbi:hypothetical protein FBEOM_5952 [Fusarium beomiforme]|uniref:Uncharacterized protein n=1 Tax=Fusarium beomiforme TaxID=44412 RepID=A0A9P5DWL4_9HYPO|nr:hypothetical protein FBEOM_5952 [Fusarium beomiforme]
MYVNSQATYDFSPITDSILTASPPVEKCIRVTEQAATNDDDGPRKDHNAALAEYRFGLGQAVSTATQVFAWAPQLTSRYAQGATYLIAINRSLGAACKKIVDAKYCKTIYTQDLATVEIDRKRETLSQFRDASRGLVQMIQKNGEKCAEQLHTWHNNAIFETEEAEKKLQHAENTLKAMEDQAQPKRKKYQKGLDYIASLKKSIAEQEIIKETRTCKMLKISRFSLGYIKRLHLASDERGG